LYDSIIALILDWEAHRPVFFAVTVILVMSLQGLFLGILADFVFKVLGIRVRKVDR